MNRFMAGLRQRILGSILCLVLVAPMTLRAQQLSATERQIVESVRQHSEEAINLLEKVVNLNSGTLNLDGVRRVGRVFQHEFNALGFKTRWVAMPDSVNRAGHLFAERQGNQGKRLLLIGHLDTVFEKDSPFQRFERQDSIARGPGVVDMKGSDVAILFALKALHAAGALANTSIIVAFTGDEEKAGSPIRVSRRDLIEAARKSEVALGFEQSARDINTASVARRGSSGWRLEVKGTRGHSSQIFKKRYGSGAIFEAARILNAFHETLRGEKYLTFNPGVILGGTEVTYDPANTRGTAFGKTNVIAQTVIVDGGLRCISLGQRDSARARMRAIVEQHLPGTSARITFRDGYPAMPPTEGNFVLLRTLSEVSQDLGYGTVEALDPGERGAADISFVAPYVDALAGIGVLGGGSHTPEEYVDLRSFSIITERTAILIFRLTR